MFNISEQAPLWLAGVFLGIHGLIQIIPISVENILAYYGVLRPLDVPVSTLSKSTSLVLHGFLHGDWGHVLMNAFMSIAFGVVTIKGIKLLQTSKGKATKSTLKFLIIFLIGVVGGGIAQWLWWSLPISNHPLGAGALGASGGASALFATAAWALGGRAKLLSFGLAWTVINLVLYATQSYTGLNIAWAAHLGGYLTGALIAPIWVRANSTNFKVTK